MITMGKKTHTTIKLCSVLSVLFFFNSSMSASTANKKNSNDFIEIGMTASITGPIGDIGQSMYSGIKAYIERTNLSGGISNKQITLTFFDDGYQPGAALMNAEKLVNEHKVIAMIGNVGTPTAKVTEPFANKNKVIFLAPFTGADIIRNYNKSPYTFNYRASYEQELNLIINDIFNKGIKLKDIVFFIQDDSYGKSGLEATRRVLDTFGFNKDEKINILRYSRNTNNVIAALTGLLKLQKNPKAIILIASYGASANFINYSFNQFPMLLYYNISFVSTHALEKNLHVDSDRVYITQVVPPLSSKLPIINELKTDLKRIGKSEKFNSTSLEGYIAAKILVSALKKINGAISSEALKKELENMGRFDAGIGIPLEFGKLNRQASQKVWLLQYNSNKRFIPLIKGENG